MNWWVVLVAGLFLLFSVREPFKVSVDLDGSILKRVRAYGASAVENISSGASTLNRRIVEAIPFRSHYYKFRRGMRR